MGEIIYSDFSYCYEGEGISEKLFDYRESIKDYTFLPMHSFDNSIDGVLKRAHAALTERYAGTDPSLLVTFFMTYLLIITRHMEEPEPVNVLCLGKELEWISTYIAEDIQKMNSGSRMQIAEDITEVFDKKFDLIIAFDEKKYSASEFFEFVKEHSTGNCRAIFITDDIELDNDGCSRYIFGNYLVLTRHEKTSAEFCIDKYVKELGNPKRTIKTVAAITPHDRPFNNYELIKDIGAVPYLFYKNKGCTVYMVGVDKDDNYSFENYVQGEELVRLDDYSLESKIRWLNEHGKDIDCLMLFGTYRNNMVVADKYKELRPDGVIYLALDASAFWINNIPRYETNVDEFYKKCDIIGTSTVPLQKFIAKKWKMDIRVVRCGYYPFGLSEMMAPVYEKKKNVILTVGRIGTNQKRTDIMMQAFAKAYPEISDWELRIVGPVENEFYGYIDEFMQEHPYLEDSISFAGQIDDKELLHQEFIDSKIFILTSEFEGFPNVIPEAMSAGNAIITTDIDNSDEVIDYGNCGLKAPINNIQKIADNIRSLCNDEAMLKRMCENSYRTYQEKFDYNLIIDNLYDELIRV